MSKQTAVLVWPQVFIFSGGNSVEHPVLDIFELVKMGMEKALAADIHPGALADDAIAQMQTLLSSDREELDRARTTIQTAVSNIGVIEHALSAGASRDEIRALITAAQAFEDLPLWRSETRHLGRCADFDAAHDELGEGSDTHGRGLLAQLNTEGTA